MEKRIKCTNCSKFINKKKKYVVLSTLSREKRLPNEHNYFHFDCWVKYFEERVLAKMETSKKDLEFMTNFAKSPVVQNILKNYKIKN